MAVSRIYKDRRYRVTDKQFSYRTEKMLGFVGVAVKMYGGAPSGEYCKLLMDDAAEQQVNIHEEASAGSYSYEEAVDAGGMWFQNTDLTEVE